MKNLIISGILLLIFMGSSVDLQSQGNWQAQWISVMESQSATNTWIAFRKEFEVNELPKEAKAKIAVDSKYWLWINGEMVVFEGGLKRGPNPRDTYYDEVNIAPYLKMGGNSIALLLWYFGKDGFSHNSSGKAGMVFQCVTPEFILMSDKTWRARLHSAYGNTDPPFPNFRLPESNIRYDARKEFGDWYEKGYMADGHGFSQVMELGVPPLAPWNHLVRRPIPQWKNFGLQSYESIKRVSGDNKDTIIAALPYNAQITPFFEVNTTSRQEIEILTDNYEGGSAFNVRAVYITREGEQSYESLGWMNGHHVYYVVPKGLILEDLKYRQTGYNTELVGSFECNDPFYNRLWKKAGRTLYITMRDTYMDCPDRERSQWIGDVVNEAEEAYYALDTNSYGLMRKAMYEMVGWQREDSTAYAPVPAGNWNRELPAQVLAFLDIMAFGIITCILEINRLLLIYMMVQKNIQNYGS